MGILDKIIKEGKELIDNVATEENKEKALDFLNTVKEGLQDVAKDVKENVSDFADDVKNTVGDLSDGVKNKLDEIKLEEEVESTYYEYDENDNRSAREKILTVLKEKFPEYKVEEEYSPTIMGGVGRFMNYSILVFKEDKPVLAIMLIGKTTTSHREYRWSRDFAKEKGITFINFINHYPNREEYIEQRLKNYL